MYGLLDDKNWEGEAGNWELRRMGGLGEMERGRKGGNWETSRSGAIATEQQGYGLCCQETAESTTNTALITKGPVRFPSFL